MSELPNWPRPHRDPFADLDENTGLPSEGAPNLLERTARLDR